MELQIPKCRDIFARKAKEKGHSNLWNSETICTVNLTDFVTGKLRTQKLFKPYKGENTTTSVVLNIPAVFSVAQIAVQ